MALHIGVLRVVLHVPAARTLKDSRAILNSLRDRVRHRFDVAVHEIEAGDAAQRRVLAVSTVGDDARLLRSIVDKVLAYIESFPEVTPTDIDVDVFQWHSRRDRTPFTGKGEE